MTRRAIAGTIWVWGLWSAGSTMEFAGLLPTWPFALAGAAIALGIVLGRWPRAQFSARSTVASRS